MLVVTVLGYSLTNKRLEGLEDTHQYIKCQDVNDHPDKDMQDLCLHAYEKDGNRKCVWINNKCIPKPRKK